MTVTNLQSAYGDIANRPTINLDRCSFSPAFDVELAVDCGAARDTDDAQSRTRHRDFDITVRCLVENFLCPGVDFACLWISAFVEIHSADVCICERKADAMRLARQYGRDRSMMRRPRLWIIVGCKFVWVISAE